MRASFYESDITPPLGGFMWGHYKEVRAMDVHERLYAKAVVVEDNGELAAIVVVDTCILPEEMHDVVTKRIFEYTGITADKVCIASNHAHTGAPVSDGGEIKCYADATYKDVFFRRVADTVILAYNRLGDSDAEVKFAESEVDGVAFCRNQELLDGKYITHGAGRPDVKRYLAEPDKSLPVLMFEKDGKPIGAIISFACHQCTTGNAIPGPGYLGDYASILSKYLKKHYGPSFVSLFLIGTAGDVNTKNSDPAKPAKRYHEIGEILAGAVIESMNNAETVKGGVKVIKESVRIKRRTFENMLEASNTISAVIYGKENPMRARNMLYYVSTNKKEYSDLYVQGIRIGDVHLSLLPGEIYTNIGKAIKERSPFKKNFVIENCNSYCGYIPTKECFNENSQMYEISLCYHSCHVPEACDILENSAVSIANKLNEK